MRTKQHWVTEDIRWQEKNDIAWQLDMHHNKMQIKVSPDLWTQLASCWGHPSPRIIDTFTNFPTRNILHYFCLVFKILLPLLDKSFIFFSLKQRQDRPACSILLFLECPAECKWFKNKFTIAKMAYKGTWRLCSIAISPITTYKAKEHTGAWTTKKKYRVQILGD